MRQDMSEREAFALLETLMRLGIMELDILGGEPMLVPYMKDFVKYVTGARITVNISTNGSLPEMVHILAKIPARFLNIGFSLHGFSDTHNAITMSDNFSFVLEGIRRVMEEGKTPIVKSVLTRTNKSEIHALLHYLGERGVKRYFLLHEDSIGWEYHAGCLSFPDFMSYFSALKSDVRDIPDIGFVAASGFHKCGRTAYGRCDAGCTKLAVLPDGSTFPCNLLAGFKEFRLGNILRDEFETIRNHPILQRFRQCKGNVCKAIQCTYFQSCSGGCPAHSYFFYRNLDAPDPRCHMNNPG